MKILKYLFLFACFTPLFIFRDFTPNNELKYLSIADEALRDGHMFTFWNHGTIYADKPPLYIWIIMLGKWLFGTHNMFYISLFSIIPALIVLYIMDKWVKNNVSVQLRISGSLMLITSGLFMGSAIVARMDMLMCLFIILTLYTFFKIYSNQYSKTDRFLFPLCIFLALFTKGPAGFFIPVSSILIFLWVKKKTTDWKKYFGWTTWLILLGLCAIWFGGVYMEGGYTYLNNLLFNQTINRAVNAFHHKEPFYYYFQVIWYALAPWTLFYATVIGIGIGKRVITTDLEKIFLIIIATTFITFSLFSSKLDIYLLPIFPFFAYLTILILPKINKKQSYITVIIPAGVSALAFPGIFIASGYINFPVLFPQLILAAFILSVSAVLSLVFIFRNKLCNAINSLAIGILLTVFTGAFALPKFNPKIGFGELAHKAKEIAKKENIDTYFFYLFRSGENMDAYLEYDIEKITIEEIKEAIKIKSFILFIRSRDIKKYPELYELIKYKEVYKIENYNIVIFDLNH